jgi:hypothetical protein
MAPPLTAPLLLASLSWGQDAPALSLRDIHDAARKLLAVSRVPDKKNVRVRHYAPGHKSEDIDGKPIEGVPAWLRSSVAGAMHANTSYNPLDTPLVYTGPSFFTHARTRSEAAFILAHEIAHLELEHGPKSQASFCAEYRDWKKKPQAPCPEHSKDYVRFRRARPWLKERWLGQERQQEYEADERGMRLAAAAGYDIRAYARLMERLAALRADPGFKDTETHPTPGDRAGHLESSGARELMADQEAF